MSRNARIGLVVAAVVVAVLAYVVASPGGSDSADKGPSGTARTSSKPAVTRIEIRGKKVVGGPVEIKAKKGDQIQIVVSADARNTLHLHGYDIEKTASAGQPARFKFKANLEGQFDLESHTFEDAGLEARVGTLIVAPR